MTTHLQLLLLSVAGWVNQHQQPVIEYLQEENRILVEQLGDQPKRFTDGERACLARKAKVLGRTRLRRRATFVTSDTLLRWFRRLVAQKWTFAKANPLGRPPVDPELEKLAIKFIEPLEPPERLPTVGRIRCQQELGGMLNNCYREAA